MSGPSSTDGPEPSTVSGDTAARLALATLPGLGPARVNWLLAAAPPEEVVACLRQGRLPVTTEEAPPGITVKLVQSWIKAARALDVEAVAAELARSDVAILTPVHPLWPFAHDPEPPVALFSVGDVALFGASPRVALVGTRRCTSIGRQVATRFGAELTEAGVVVVSGLATGIDGAAHSGALAAGGRPLAVVGTGIDVVYPGANRRLWHEVSQRGLLISEAPLGTKPERWRFPARNRLLAGLADVTVVIESHATGGALLTAGEAADRGRQVMAVPGAVTSPASVGSNRLLVDGCAPACSTNDIVDLLRFTSRPTPAPVEGRAGPANTTGRSWAPSLPFVSAGAGRGSGRLAKLVLAEVAAGATHVDALVEVSGLPVAEVLAEIHHLQAAGLIKLDGSTVHSP
jgi:DNA processing protein